MKVRYVPERIAAVAAGGSVAAAIVLAPLPPSAPPDEASALADRVPYSARPISSGANQRDGSHPISHDRVPVAQLHEKRLDDRDLRCQGL